MIYKKKYLNSDPPSPHKKPGSMAVHTCTPVIPMLRLEDRKMIFFRLIGYWPSPKMAS